MYPRSRDPTYPAGSPPKLRVRDRVALALVVLGLPVAYMSLAPGSHPRHAVLLLLVAGVLVGAAVVVERHGLIGGVIVGTLLTLATAVASRMDGPLSLSRGERLALPALAWAVGVVGGVLADRRRARQRWATERERATQRQRVLEALASLSAALGAHDAATRRHGEDVAALAADLGRELGLGTDDVETLRLAGLVHDIGKLGVSSDVLLKPGALDELERRAVERHPEIAAAILLPLHGIERIAEAVRAHHEAPDGSGYPLGLVGEQIPPLARVLRVADVFCSLLEERPYKPSHSVSAVLEMMRPLAGSKLDADVMNALEHVLQAPRARMGTSVALSPRC